SNHGRRRWRLQGQVAKLPEQIEAWEKREADAQALVDAIHLPAERKELAIEVDGKSLQGEAAVQAVMEAIDKSLKGRRTQINDWITATPAVLVGRVAGVDVSVYTTTSFAGENPVVSQVWRIQTGDASMT